MNDLLSVLEERQMMTREELRLQRIKNNVRARKNVLLFTLIFSPVMYFGRFTDNIYTLVLLWLGPTTLIIFAGLRNGASGMKLVTRGQITARYERDSEDTPSYVFQINDKLFSVSENVFRKYHKRDIVELHFTEEGDLLDDRLLERPR